MVSSSRACEAAARLATLLVAGFLLAGTTSAQPISDRPASPEPTGKTLHLVVLQGLAAVNDFRTPTTTMLVIEVRDENYLPLEGATVEFELSATPPSGSFEGGMRIKKAVTNVQGQAFTTFEPNQAAGRVSVEVRATFGTRTGAVTIKQPTTPAQSRTWIGRHKPLAIVIAVGVAGAATAAILTTRGGASSPSSKPTVTITSGIPTFGSPQ